MKKIFLFCSLLCCMLVLNAQGISQFYTNKELMSFRFREKVILVDDYIKLITLYADSSNIRRYYVQQVLNLFSQDAIAKVSEPGCKDVKEYNVSDFLQQLAHHNDAEIVSIDSVSSECQCMKFSSQKIDDSLLFSSRWICQGQHDTVFVLEDTEDGVEYNPFLGDIFVSIKKRKQSSVSLQQNNNVLAQNNNSISNLNRIKSVPNLKQIKIGEQLMDDDMYFAKVTLLDEFRRRFNFEELHPKIKVSEADYQTKNMMLLFNFDSIKDLNGPKYATAVDFISTVIANKVKLNYTDTTWYAKATCHGKIEGKEAVFDIYLTVQSRGHDMYKWVINDVEGKDLMLTPIANSNQIMLLPNAHETRFMELCKLGNNPKASLDYVSKSYQSDPTTVFFMLLKEGKISIEYVDPVDFYFLQVPGYVFVVRRFERETQNAGWLIDEVWKTSDKEKRNILNKIYNK